MHALKSYSDSSTSDDDKKISKGRRDTKKHDRYLERHEKKERYTEYHKRFKHSQSGYSREEHSRCKRDSHHLQDERKKGRSRSRSPIKKKLPTEYKQPEQPKKMDMPTIPPLAQAQAASVLLSAQLSQKSQLQLQLSKTKQQSIDEKRKMLWSSKKQTVTSQNQWEQVTFSEGDSQMQTKFRRLMGMGSATTSEETNMETNKAQNKPTEVMKNLEQQYEASRYLTHMARGMGLGYGCSSPSSDSTDLNK